MKKFIAFFEIPTVDFHRAVDFYETVFGVQLPVFECEEEKMACFTEEGEMLFLPHKVGIICSKTDQHTVNVRRAGLGEDIIHIVCKVGISLC